MSTRSTISIIRKNGSKTKIYCHWDGYVEHNGVILQEFYNTPNKVEKLLALGNLSSLGKQLGPFGDNPCVAYCRDKHEDFNQMRDDDLEEYNYTFDVNECVWYVDYHRLTKTSASNILNIPQLFLDQNHLLLDVILDSLISQEKKEICIEKAKEGRALAN